MTVDRQSVSERTTRDMAKQFAAQMTVGVCAAFFSAWLNRMLPAKELALWPVCAGLGSVVAALSSCGLGDTLVRLVPGLVAKGERDEAGGVLKTGLLINLAGCTVFSVLLYLFAGAVAPYLLHEADAAPLIRSMAVAAFLSAFAERLSWALQSVQEFGKGAVITVVVGVIRTPLAVALSLLLGGARGVILSLSVIGLLGCALSLAVLWRHLFVSRRMHSPVALVRFSYPFYGVSLVSLLNARVNNLVIAVLVAPEILAAYFVAHSITGYVYSVSKFAIAAVTPKLSETDQGDPAARARVFLKCTRYSFLVLLPFHVFVAVAATPLLQLYGGHKYASAGPVLMVMCAGLFISALYQLQRAHIQVFARPVHLFGLSLTQAAANIGSLALLVRPFGALGAALSEAVVAVTQAVASFFVLRQTMPVSYDGRALGRALVGSAVGALALWAAQPLWQQHAWPVLPALLAATVVYALTLARGLQTADTELLVGCLPRRVRTSRPGKALAGALTALWVRP